MKKIGLTIAIVLLAGLSAAAQAIAPQYTLNINFFGSGIYGQTSAMNNVFGYQLTTNMQLEGDLLAAPGGGVSDYEAGGSYNLCGIKAIENALALTSLNCGKIEPFAAFVAGVGRVQQGLSPTVEGPAAMAKIGVGLPSASGSYAVEFVGGYGDFGPSITGQSNKGLFFYTGFTFGAGNNEAATQAKIARLKRAEIKKRARLMAKLKAPN